VKQVSDVTDTLKMVISHTFNIVMSVLCSISLLALQKGEGEMAIYVAGWSVCVCTEWTQTAVFIIGVELPCVIFHGLQYLR
jgi:hypothetical protein